LAKPNPPTIDRKPFSFIYQQLFLYLRFPFYRSSVKTDRQLNVVKALNNLEVGGFIVYSVGISEVILSISLVNANEGDIL